MKNILLPTDFSENSWNAITYAIDFFANENCNFYLMHVNRFDDVMINESPYIAPEETIEVVYTKPAKLQLRKLLKRIAQRFSQNKQHKFYTISAFGFFIESIRKHVEDKNIDCVVMGTKGASGLKKIMGSNTGDVITKVKCTTLAVPESAKFTKLKEIAFPTDFLLAYETQILRPLSEIIETNNSALRILHIKKKNAQLNYDQTKNRELLDNYFDHLTHSFHYLTNKKVEDAIQCFVESRNINMICMVAKNLNYFQQILFHSKVEEISYHIEIPFLVLHEKN
ncbi:Nucleotide-binding universal stress protein, UspA family [Hyunsoonleella jejuensis]|uniref:Nucleotide-binding universal stress protein, UspA family n=1 Tax=Hyunsoonleella jejuensis TaxID=419940 RepID=A0A1H9FBU0_9FLAO|nr:universal stress protein [Hyunsoonleella jejuensis]SEQ35335.1 Nucleotide-binding universal stress protein, UspA family [Hyunsoonleella jejuensis]